MGFLVTFIGLSVVIFIHELGHFLAAKRAGIRVHEFAIGMGPKLMAFKRGDTQYSFRLLLLGGFVQLEGQGQHSDAPDAYCNQPILGRFWTIFWGPLMNLILGILIFWGIFFVKGVPDSSLMVDTIQPQSPAEQAAIQHQDIITGVDDVSVSAVRALSQYLATAKDTPVTLQLLRNNQPMQVTVTPQLRDDKYVIGVSFKTIFRPGSFWEISVMSAKMTMMHAVGVVKGIGMLVTGNASMKDMTGPIGIVQFATFNLSKGVLDFLNVIAIISISLGIINLFPIPILDGGHIVMLGIERIMGRQLNETIVNAVSNVALVGLVTLMGAVIVNDIRFWQDRVSLFQRLFAP
jgi:regulator of sigma E protease